MRIHKVWQWFGTDIGFASVLIFCLIVASFLLIRHLVRSEESDYISPKQKGLLILLLGGILVMFFIGALL